MAGTTTQPETAPAPAQATEATATSSAPTHPAEPGATDKAPAAPESALAAAAKSDDTAPTTPTPAAPIELKLPEGFKADEKAVEGFKALAAETGLDSAKAQKVFDHYVAVEQARTKAAEDAFSAQDAKWANELQADPDVGGDKFKGAVMDVRRALGKFGGKQMVDLLQAAGLGNHPDIFKGFAAIGRALAEDSVAGTARAAGEGRRALKDILYPTTVNEKET